MPITSVTTHPDELKLEIIADFPVSVRRLWDAYLDPRQIERFWGPTTYPATFLRHDGYVGGLSNYRMLGPDGDLSCGYWEWTAVEDCASFEVKDGFAHDDGTPNHEMPHMRMVFAFAPTALGSRLTMTTYFNSLDEFEQLLAMGMQEGTESAMSQIDDVVADLVAFAAGKGAELQLIGDTQVRISRIIRGSAPQVWQAQVDPELLRRWQLGPDGWSMPVCEYGSTPGEQLRTEWQNDETGERFGFAGRVVESAPPHRLVTTERMINPEDPDGENSPESLNEVTLTEVEGGTLLTYLITYPDTATREVVIATGMVDGMEAGYARLETLLG